ncbi:MAG TPA: hypothetical protein VHC39_15620, partial [Rhizomicrobium sp.]|nr:hypothetical protein [Rhizomicrobium sp.]
MDDALDMVENGAGLALVPDRECGNCTVCCVALRVDDPGLKKPAGEPCRHLGQQGCTIYQTRYAICRSWMCGWRLQPELDDSWRPDRSGVLLIPEPNTKPGYAALGYKVQLASRTALASPEVLNKLCGYIAAATPLWLSLAGVPTKVFLNPELGPLI